MNSSKYHQKVLNILQKQTINSFVGYDGQVAGNNKTHGSDRGFCPSTHLLLGFIKELILLFVGGVNFGFVLDCF